MDSSRAESVSAAAERVPPVLTEAPPPVPRGVAGRSRHSPAIQVRAWSAFILVVCGGMLAVGLSLKPSIKGLGTHSESLGLPPCGFYASTGIPCPTCGCTTAVTHVAHGHVFAAVRTQPFGAAVGLIAAALCILAVIGLITGRWRGPQPFSISWYWRTWVLAGVALLVAGWVYKIFAVRAGW